MAAYGDDTGLGAVSGSNRPQYHLDLVRSKWQTLVTPFITGWASGGVFAEGTNYESTRPMAMVADSFLTSFADNRYASLPFFRAAYQWQLQQVAPDLVHYIYLGEQARDSEGGIIYYERSNHLMLASFPGVATPAEKAMSYSIVQHWPVRQPDASLGLAALDLVYWDLGVTPSADLSSLPKGFVDRPSGVVVYRNDWSDPNSTLLFFESGKILESHQLFNANGLMIWKGGYWVLGHGQMWDHEYDLGQSSTLYTSGGQQTWQEATDSGGVLLASDVQSSYVYVAGQAKEAYGRATSRPLADFVRKVVYLPSLEAFVIADRVVKNAAADTLTWKWWARGAGDAAPTANGASFVLQNRDGSANLYGQTLSNDTSVSRSTGTGGHYIETVRADGLAQAVAITALRLGTTPGAAATQSASLINVRIGGWHIALGKSEAAQSTVTFDSDAAQFVVTDLERNVTYQATGGGSTAEATSSADGVVTFNLPASASRTVTVTRR
jgi:hypothetical protein